MATNRKPVQLERIGGKSNRDLIWAEIRRQRSFTLKSLSKCLRNTTEDTIRSYLTCLCAADYLASHDNGKTIIYALLKDCGVDAPRLRKDGSPVTQGRGNENMWRTMRILKTFDWQDVMIAASTETVKITKKTARAYIETLAKAGYLRCISESKPGVRAIYRFVKNTGAKPPVIQRGGSLYDPNVGKVVYSRSTNQGIELQGACHE